MDSAAPDAQEAGLGPSRRLKERAPFPGWYSSPRDPAWDYETRDPSKSVCANLIYADNNAVFGIQQQKVDKCFQDLTTAVTDRHLPLHEIQKSSDRGDLLGCTSME